MVLEGGAGAVAIRLAAGRVDATVAHRRPGQTFAVVTPDLRVEVRGTTFSVTKGPNGSRVEVSEGRVEVRFADGRSTFVAAGGSADTAVRDEPATPTPPTPGEGPPAAGEGPPACAEIARTCQAATRAARVSMRGRDAARALRLIADGTRGARAGEATCGAGVTACQDELGYLRAEALHLGGQIADAVAAYHALDRRGAPPAMRQNALYAAAQLERRQGRAVEARADYERALAAAPRGALHEEALAGAMESAAGGGRGRASGGAGEALPRRISERAGGPDGAPVGPRRRSALSRTRRRVAWTLLLAAAIGCRREVELTLPRPVPTSTCAANAATCGGDGECCSAACRDGRCVAATCRVEGTPCQVGADCCSFVCAADPAGTGARLCANPAGCASDGQACGHAGACCGLGCNAGMCGGSVCASAGEPCESAADCCAGACMAGTCAMPAGCHPAGEACAMAGDCCGLACVSVGESGGSNCQLLSGCRVDGEGCASGADCCSGRCTSMPGGGSRCQALPACRPTQALCMNDGECCSGACEPSPEGPRRCARISGCQPEQERCAIDADCCSGACNAGPEDVARCAKAAGMKPGRCRPLGERCAKADECCGGERCGVDADGRMRCLPAGEGCAPNGYSCRVAAECCGGFMAPQSSQVTIVAT